MSKYFLKLKNPFDISCLGDYNRQIEEQILNLENVSIYQNGTNFGVYPKDRTDIINLFPGINDIVQRELFKGSKDPVLTSGCVSLYFTFPGENTRMPIHKDLQRRCSINMNFRNAENTVLDFFESEDESTRLTGFSMTENDATLINTEEFHGVNSRYIQTKMRAIITYSWYTPAFAFEPIAKRLVDLGLAEAV